MTLIDAFRAWLPVPTYDFVGGPCDGVRLTVSLIETEGGMIAPEIWRVSEPLSAPTSFEGTDAYDSVALIHTYRFIAEDRFRNAGYYEFIAPAAELNREDV